MIYMVSASTVILNSELEESMKVDLSQLSVVEK